MYEYPYYSPARIQEVLRRKEGGIRKRWGQNFLTDPNHARKIAEVILDVCGDPVAEIGPGLGVLTHHLLGAGRRVRAVEIDPLLAEILAEEIAPAFPDFELLRGDALELLTPAPPDIDSVCGNLPYYISTDLLRLAARHYRRAVFLCQKEFAERAAAKEAESSLPVYLGVFGDWRVVASIPPGAFYPVPGVSSSLLVFQAREEGARTDPLVLEKLLRMSFSAKRKKLRNSWKKSGRDDFSLEVLEAAAGEAGVDPELRPERVSLEAYYRMADFLVGAGPGR